MDAQDEYAGRHLLLAANNEDEPSLVLRLKSGALRDSADKRCRTALIKVREEEHDSVVSLLEFCEA